MKYRYLSDCHCHTDCSFDGRDSAMMMCDSAARLGLFALTITDHCDLGDCYGYAGADSCLRVAQQSYFEARKAAAAFRGRLHVYAGMELGQAVQDPKSAAELVSLCRSDFILGSVHNLPGEKDFYDLDYSAIDLPAYLHRYFDEVLDTVRLGYLDSLAHLTYPWRYARQPLPYAPYWQQIEAILRELIRQGKSLEVNTSGLRQHMGCTMPDAPILQMYHDLGGKRVTLGSDAHRWGDVASGIEEGMALLRALGFTHFAVYAARQPVMYPII